MTTRAGWAWWVGTALAAVAGVCLSAPHAAADCAAHRFTLGASPFDPAPRPEKAQKTGEIPARPAPCHGPHCGRAPSHPAPPAPVNPRSVLGDEWTWVGTRTASPDDRASAWRHGDSLLAPLFSPTPPEPPPR
jgi:hypothetical protein